MPSIRFDDPSFLSSHRDGSGALVDADAGASQAPASLSSKVRFDAATRVRTFDLYPGEARAKRPSPAEKELVRRRLENGVEPDSPDPSPSPSPRTEARQAAAQKIRDRWARKGTGQSVDAEQSRTAMPDRLRASVAASRQGLAPLDFPRAGVASATEPGRDAAAAPSAAEPAQADAARRPPRFPVRTVPGFAASAGPAAAAAAPAAAASASMAQPMQDPGASPRSPVTRAAGIGMR